MPKAEGVVGPSVIPISVYTVQCPNFYSLPTKIANERDVPSSHTAVFKIFGSVTITHFDSVGRQLLQPAVKQEIE